jgi:hypothetical protein
MSMDILGMVNRATELIDEGLNIYHSVKGEVTDASAAHDDDTLEQAKARLESSIQRATLAHDSLKAAIDARLNK